MPAPMSDLERRVLDYLTDYLRSNTYQPSVREIGREFAIKSTKTVSEVLQSLADKGWIERDPSRSRGVRLLGMELDAGAASLPLYALDDAADTPARLELDRSLITQYSRFVLPMTGDYLAEQGILGGDFLVVEAVSPRGVESGDILVIRQGGSTRPMRCSTHGDTLVLDATRPGEQPLRVSADAATDVVIGRVTTGGTTSAQRCHACSRTHRFRFRNACLTTPRSRVTPATSSRAPATSSGCSGRSSLPMPRLLSMRFRSEP
jgi:repressor LexA